MGIKMWLFSESWNWVVRWTEDECAICYTPNRLHAKVGSCGHGFCILCVDTLQTTGQASCPLCRGQMDLLGWDG
jgi:hypothetical protein